MVNINDINQIITTIIDNNKDNVEKCKPYIQSLPYDGNARTEGKLNRRKNVIEQRISDANELIKEHENLIKGMEKQKEELKKQVDKEKKKLDDYNKNMTNSKSYIDSSFEDVNDMMKDYIDNVFDDDMNELGFLWSNWGFGKEFKQVYNLSNKIFKGFGKLGKDIDKLYDKDKFSDTNLKSLIKDSKKLSSILDKTYNKKNGNVVLNKYASSQMNKITHKLEDISNGTKSYQNNKGKYDNVDESIDLLNSDIENLDYHISNSNESISNLKTEIKDYTEELGKVDNKLNA